MGLRKKMIAEMMGTAILVLGGIGAAMFAGSTIGTLGIALAFGLALVGGAYALGHVSGAHFNPAVTLGLVAGGRMDLRDAVPYMVAQVIGALLGAWIVYLIATGKAGFDVTAGFASNGYGEHSPGGFDLKAVFIAEAVLTFVFVFVIMGSTTAGTAAASHAPLAIGLTLAVLHLVSIPISNTSLNPARSTATAIFEGGWAMDQLWLFWAAPVLGGVVAGLVNRLSDCCCCKEGGCCK